MIGLFSGLRSDKINIFLLTNPGHKRLGILIYLWTIREIHSYNTVERWVIEICFAYNNYWGFDKFAVYIFIFTAHKLKRLFLVCLFNFFWLRFWRLLSWKTVYNNISIVDPLLSDHFLPQHSIRRRKETLSSRESQRTSCTRYWSMSTFGRSASRWTTLPGYCQLRTTSPY